MRQRTGFVIGLAAIIGGALAFRYGIGQCILGWYDPWCPLKFDGPVWGGIAAIVAGAVWIAVLGLKPWLAAGAAPRHGAP